MISPLTRPCFVVIEPILPATAAGIAVWKLPEREGHLCLQAFRQRCAAEGLIGVYIEPGPRLATALIESAAVDYCFHYLAPKYLSDAAAAGMGSARQRNPWMRRSLSPVCAGRSWGTTAWCAGFCTL